MTRSTPSISSSGNISPASTMIRSSPSSKTVMFLPISPRPPRGITRSLSAMLQETHLLRHRLRRDLLRWSACGGGPLQDRRDLLEILLDHLAHVARVKGRRRMVHRDEVDAVLDPRLAVRLADRIAREEPGQRIAAQAHDHLRPDELDLALQVLAAGLDLPRQRVAVVGRPALHNVGDEHLLPRQAYGGEQLLQEAPGRADEGAGLLVLVEARTP